MDYVAVFLAFWGAISAISGAGLIGFTQAASFPPSIWPMPGLILLEWGLLGVSGLASTALAVWKPASKWLLALWAITGGFVPMVIIGAFSIGPYVFIGYVFFLAACLLLTFRHKPGWLKCAGWFMLGLIANLVIILLFVSLGISSQRNING